MALGHRRSLDVLLKEDPQREAAPMLTVVLYIFIILAGIAFLAGTALKSQQQAKGLARCNYCNSRLRFQGFMVAGNGSGVAGYAAVCRQCGRRQVSAPGMGRPDHPVALGPIPRLSGRSRRSGAVRRHPAPDAAVACV